VKICIWGAWYDSNNVGDQAILMAIAKLLSERIPDLEMTVFSNLPEFTQGYMENIYPVRSISQRHQLFRTLRELMKCDLFLIGGGTPFYDDWFHLLAMLLLVLTTRLAGKPVMTYAISVRPIRSVFGRLVTKLILKMIRTVTVREPLASQSLINLGVKNPAVFIDPAITISPVDPKLVDSYLSGIGLDLSAPIFAICPHIFQPSFGYHIHHYEKFTDSQIDKHHHLLAKGAEYLSSHGQVLFVPFNTENPDDDRLTNNLIQSIMSTGESSFQIQDQLSPQFISGILNRCELVLAVRFHAAVLASAMKTPLVAISYGPKIKGYMEHIGLGKYVKEFTDLDEDGFLSILSDVNNHRDKIRGILTQNMPKMVELAEDNAELVKNLHG